MALLGSALSVALLHGVVRTDPVVLGAAWPEVVAAASRERVIGLVHAAIASGELVLPSAGAREVARLHQESMLFGITVDAVLRDVARALMGEGIPLRVLKGVATARLLYPDAGERDTGDLDLLVSEADFERAIDVIAGLGAIDPAVQVPGRHFRSAAKERTLMHPQGVEIDLHHRVQAVHRGSALSSEFLFEAGTEFEVAGVTVQALSATGQLLHACLHLACGDTRLSTMADLLRLLNDPRLDIDRALSVAQAEGVAGYVAWAIERAEDWSPLPERVVAAQRGYRVTRRDRWTARYFQSHPRAAWLVDAVSTPDRVARLVEIVWPSPAFLEHMGRSRGGHLLHLARRASGFVRPRRSGLRSDDGRL